MSPDQERDFLKEECNKLINDINLRIKQFELRTKYVGDKNENKDK